MASWSPYIFVNSNVTNGVKEGKPMPDETVTFLSKAKKLITQNKRSVAGRADFVQGLALIGILNIDEI